MRRVVLMLAVVALASVLATVWALRADASILKEDLIPMDVKVEDHYGFNTDTDALHFGKVPPKGEGIRSFLLNNTYAFPVVVELSIKGDLAPWTSATESIVYLEPSAAHQVNLSVTIPEGTPYGLYTGTLRAVFKREGS